jgi:hypothetical protein
MVLTKVCSLSIANARQWSPRNRFRGPFKVARPATKPCRPSQATLNDPSPGQQAKPLLGFWSFDDPQLDARRLSSGCGVSAGLALSNQGHRDGAVGERLHLVSQLLDVRACWLMGGCDRRGQS